MSTTEKIKLRTGRGAELMLLVFAVLIVGAAEAIIDATRDGRIGSDVGIYAGVAAAIGLVTHATVRIFARFADPIMVPCVVLINGLGLVMIHRLDLGLKQSATEGGPHYYGPSAPTQMVWSALGVALFVGMLVIVRDHRILARYAYTIGLAGLVFLAVPSFLPARYSEVNGAKIWIRAFGFSLQPGELAKIALCIFASSYLVGKRDVLSLAGRKVLGLEMPRGRDLGPVLFAWLICIGVLVLGHDLGTSLMFFGLFVVLLYVATERVSWLIIGLLLFAGGTVAAYHLFANLRTRVDVWLDPFQYANTGYQIRQSLFGLGTGGVFGTGLGGGNPENVPVVKSDFIISAFGEEVGLFGLVALLVVYGLLIFRGLSAALARARRVQQVVGHRTRVLLGSAAVRGRRRRDQAAAGDGADDTVPVLRRLIPGGELCPVGAADQGVRRRAATEHRAPRATAQPADRIRGGEVVNRPIRRVGAALGVLLLALLINLNVVQFFRASGYRDNPQNRRILLDDYGRQRGRLVVSGVAIATSVKTSDRLKYLRKYPQGPEYARPHRLRLAGLRQDRYGAGGVGVAERRRERAVHRAPVRPAHRPRPARWRRRAHHQQQGPGRGLQGDGVTRRRRGGHRPEDRRDPGRGEHAVLRPERADHPFARTRS